MTNGKSNKRALFGSVIALVLCFSMLIGTTFAWFTDSASSGKNTITAGNLDIELEYLKDGEWASVQDQTDLVNPDALWEPGYTEVVYLRIRNAGTLALKYQFAMNIVSETIATNVAGDPFKLSQYLRYGFVEGDTIFVSRDAARAAVVSPLALSDYSDGGQLEAGEVRNFALVIYMPETVGNEANYRGDVIPTIELGLNLTATQYTFESDSFDELYDADAVTGNLVRVSSAEELSEALNAAYSEDTTILLTDSINLSCIEWNAHVLQLSADTRVTLDGNGKTLYFLNTSAAVGTSGFMGCGLISGVQTNDTTNVGTLTIRNLNLVGATITNNSGATSAAGVLVGACNFTNLIVDNCKISDAAVTSDAYAAAVVGYIQSVSANSVIVKSCEVTDSDFTGNDATGALIGLSNCAVTIDGATVTGNTIDGGAGYSAAALVGTSIGGMVAFNVVVDGTNSFAITGTNYQVACSTYGYYYHNNKTYSIN